MFYLINYINGTLFIHFSEMIQNASIEIFNSQKQVIKSFLIHHKDFAKFEIDLPKGNYKIKVIEKDTVHVKSIIVNK
jgi:hypothetical protein